MAIDRDLRAMFNGTLRVRRPTPSVGGSSETLGDEETFDAYVEQRTGWIPGAQPKRVTLHFVVVDAADVAASSLGALRDTDRYWINGESSSNVSLGKKPGRLEGPLKDPDNPTVETHWELEL